jgi:hypothetical protein
MVGIASVHGAGRKIKAFMGRIEKGPSMGTMIEIQTLAHDGSFKAYCAEPASSPRAAVIVIQEIFGVNPGIREKCDAWAQEGYLALAPDLFWRIQEGVELDPDIPDQFQMVIWRSPISRRLSGKPAPASAMSMAKSARSASALAAASLISPPRGPTSTPASAIMGSAWTRYSAKAMPSPTR